MCTVRGSSLNNLHYLAVPAHRRSIGNTVLLDRHAVAGLIHQGGDQPGTSSPIAESQEI
jgi:hypothetical protein